MKNLMFVIVSLIISGTSLHGANVVLSDNTNLDSLQLVLDQYDQTINVLKAENKKLEKQDIFVKILLLLMGGIVGFFFSRLNSHYENKNRIKKEFKIHYETLVGNFYKYEATCKLLKEKFRNDRPNYVIDLTNFFNEVKSHYNDKSNFSYGENISSKIVEIREYFTNSSLVELISAFTKAIAVYNVLYRKSLNSNSEIIVKIMNTMKNKADNIV